MLSAELGAAVLEQASVVPAVTVVVSSAGFETLTLDAVVVSVLVVVDDDDDPDAAAAAAAAAAATLFCSLKYI